MVHPDRLADYDLVEAMTSMICRCKVEDFAGQQQALLDRPDASDLLSGISCPTLVACGREDAWAPPEQHQEMADGIAESRFEVIENCGHMSPMERPAELTALLKSWLEAPE
jgi:pimeloyl-ACP methyl ester carboxylesterase